MRRLTCAHFPEQGETCLDVVGTFVDQRALIDAIQDFRAREACGELLKVDHFAGLPMVGQKRTCKALQNGGVVRQCGAAWQSRAVGEQLLGVAYLADNERPYRAGDHSARCLLGVAPMETEHYFGQDPVQGGWGARGQVMDAYRFAVMLVPHESELSR
ncbi:hypothetical protein [Ferrimonas marina]|nr:hypothetical protein [Ferrimonas marina]